MKTEFIILCLVIIVLAVVVQLLPEFKKKVYINSVNEPFITSISSIDLYKNSGKVDFAKAFNTLGPTLSDADEMLHMYRCVLLTPEFFTNLPYYTEKMDCYVRNFDLLTDNPTNGFGKVKLRINQELSCLYNKINAFNTTGTGSGSASASSSAPLKQNQQLQGPVYVMVFQAPNYPAEKSKGYASLMNWQVGTTGYNYAPNSVNVKNPQVLVSVIMIFGNHSRDGTPQTRTDNQIAAILNPVFSNVTTDELCFMKCLNDPSLACGCRSVAVPESTNNASENDYKVWKEGKKSTDDESSKTKERYKKDTCKMGQEARIDEWVCPNESKITTPLRRNQNGDIECLSTNNRDCIWGVMNNKQCRDVVHSVNPRNVKPLACGQMHKNVWGGDGYSTPNHWCAVANKNEGLFPKQKVIYTSKCLSSEGAGDQLGNYGVIYRLNMNYKGYISVDLSKNTIEMFGDGTSTSAKDTSTRFGLFNSTSSSLLVEENLLEYPPKQIAKGNRWVRDTNDTIVGLKGMRLPKYKTFINTGSYGLGAYVAWSNSIWGVTYNNINWEWSPSGAFDKDQGDRATSGGGGAGWHVNENACTYTNAKDAVEQPYLIIQMPERVVLRSYSLEVRAGCCIEQMPTKWVVYGSNDPSDVDSWTVLDTQIGIKWSKLAEVQTFNIGNMKAYTSYRIVVQRNGSPWPNCIHIGEWRLFCRRVSSQAQAAETYIEMKDFDAPGNDIRCFTDGSLASRCKDLCDKDKNCVGYNRVEPGGVWGGNSGCCYKKSATTLAPYPTWRISFWKKK